MSDDPKTAEQLRAEIAALKQRIAEKGTRAGIEEGSVVGKAIARRAKRAQSLTKPGSQGLLARLHVPLTRRSSFAMWLAPAILLAPVMKKAKRMAKKVKRHVDA